jgi:hypothetical protein
VDVSPLARCDRDRAYPSVPLMRMPAGPRTVHI